jgi:short-subunit dehydrogenase
MKKVILITGASSGMGKDTALDLIKLGHTVYGAARRVEKMDDLLKAGGQAIKLDVTDQSSIENCVKQIVKDQGKIDVLWNNAGYAEYGSVEDIPLDVARRQFEVNIFGLAALTKEVLPVMRNQKAGLIINTSSMGGKIYTPMGSWYHATKHALEGWSDCLRIETKQFGIKVVILEPGAIKTEFGEVMMAPLMERSKNSPYEPMAKALEKSMLDMEKKPDSFSPGSLISKTIQKIIRANNPKTRYVAGKMAKPMIFMRKWGGDRLFDKVVMQMVK